MPKFLTSGKSTAAFSRVDLAVMVFILMALGAIGAAFVARSQQAKIAQCASNLKELGMGMALYTKEDDDKLPFACIQYDDDLDSVAWDGLIYSYVKWNGEVSCSSLDRKSDLLRCPADTTGNRTRTYAMPLHDMSPANWPLGPENRTGVGLWWKYWENGNDSLKNAYSKDGKMLAVRLEMIQVPASTLLLTEHASSINNIFAYNGATISGPDDHLDLKARRMNRYHNGKFNYLMVDGHVELLLPTQKPGIWTIYPGD